MSKEREKILSPSQVEQFGRDGFLILKNFYLASDVSDVCEGIYQVIGQVLRRHGLHDSRPVFNVDQFDAGFVDMIRKDRQLGSEIYDAVKFIPAFWRLVSNPHHAQLMRELRVGSVPALAASGCGIRIDNPNEDKFRALWHQEYPAQLRSLDGLVFWSPLVSMTEPLGPVALCPGSHRLGALPVQRLQESSSGRSGAYALQLANEDQLLARFEQTSPLTQPTDLILIDFLTLHASGFNRSDRSRWSMQFRYFNMVEPTGRTHGWKGSYAEGIDFSLIHPELIA
jgi:Phytanoyl-CoA dioxygenase (PhyH)